MRSLAIKFIDPHSGLETMLRIADWRGAFMLNGRWYRTSDKRILSIGDKIRIKRHPNAAKGKRPPKKECEAEVVDGKAVLSREQKSKGHLWEIAARSFYNKVGAPFDPKAIPRKHIEAWESSVFSIIHAHRNRLA